ncbi:hypothetical protein ABMA28_010060 [Loxostege sticticalis]|uniref:Peptidase S1 domain-containing protein n=1 Tax=Loxostege sticticalis TaxID=481309 RepID=A0ABD0S9K3_LOXSC
MQLYASSDHRELKMKLSFLCVLLFSIYFVYGNEICSPLNGVDRTCMHYQDCPQEIQDWVTMYPKPAHILKQLRDARCGETGSRKLCCPAPECYTWDGRPGVCVKYNETIFDENISYWQIIHSRCINKDPKSVCHSHLPVRQSGVCESEISAFPPDPSYGCCGKELVVIDKVTGGQETSIDEFPWLAVLKYPEDKKNCSGVLISGKYVLTAAHCVAMSLHEKPYAVILGEHDKSTVNDCDHSEDCHNTTVTIRIDDITVHPEFDSSSTLKRHDIALIRLDEMVTYSDFILPICLPIEFRDTTKNPPADFKLWTAGWGTIDSENHHPSDIKLKVQLPFVNPWECAVSYPQLWSSQMCAGGNSNEDLCISDSGSPLMHDRFGTFEVLGITSSVTKCGAAGVPAIYTKVFPYIRWIHNTIRP